jgi:membrane protein DedA with SNARE-associated domain
MRFKSFVVASTIGTAGWTAILAMAGYQLQQNVQDVDKIVGPASNAILAVLAGGYVWRLWRFRPDKRD